MEQSGEVPEPEEPATLPTPLPPPSLADPLADESGPDGRGFLVAGIVVLVAIVGVVAWLARPDDALDTVAREEGRFPAQTTLGATSAPTATAPAATAPAATAPAAPSLSAPPLSTAPVAPAPGPTEAPGTANTAEAQRPVAPPTLATTTTVAEDAPYVARLVPSLVGLAEAPANPDSVAATVAGLLTAGRHDVAVAGPVAAVCATVPMDRPLALGGRWERDGRRIAATDVERRDVPGFGECLTAEGDDLDEGSYQYVAVDSDGGESAAGGLVVGAARVDQRFLNDSGLPVCIVRIAPSVSRYFEAYVFVAEPIAPAATITLPVAAVEQDVETVACDGGEIVSRFSFDPSGAIQPLDP